MTLARNIRSNSRLFRRILADVGILMAMACSWGCVTIYPVSSARDCAAINHDNYSATNFILIRDYYLIRYDGILLNVYHLDKKKNYGAATVASLDFLRAHEPQAYGLLARYVRAIEWSRHQSRSYFWQPDTIALCTNALDAGPVIAAANIYHELLHLVMREIREGDADPVLARFLGSHGIAVADVPVRYGIAEEQMVNRAELAFLVRHKSPFAPRKREFIERHLEKFYRDRIIRH